MKNKQIGKTFIFLHVVLFLYSICNLLSKKASSYEFLSPKFILFYGGMIVLLMVYAVLWQQVLKRMPLTIAFANKSVVILWGILWGVLFFEEVVTWNMILGAIIISVGVFFVGAENE